MQQSATRPVLFTIDDLDRMIDAGKVETFVIGQTVSPLCLTDATPDLHWLFRE